MIILIAFLTAAAVGWFKATKRDGTVADRVQYALSYGIAAALAALVVVTLAARMGWIG